MSTHDLAMVINTFVIDLFDYCNMLHEGLLLKTVQKLQLLHNEAVQLLSGIRRYDPLVSCLLHSVLNSRCWLFFKILDSLGPNYLKD